MKEKKYDLTEAEREEIVRKFNNGTPSEREEAITATLDAMDSYIYYMIHKRFESCRGMMEDLVQESRLAIIEHLKEYNPKYKMTTFFQNHIQNALQDCANQKNNESHYYAESKNMLIKAARELGMDPDNLDEQTLALKMGYTTARVRSILSNTLYKRDVALIDDMEETSVGFSESPEEAFLKNDRRESFINCIMKLEELEQAVLCMHFGFSHPKYNPEERVYTLKEIQAYFDKRDAGINMTNVYRSARRHITDILYKSGVIKKRNKYREAKEDRDIVKRRDVDMANDLFEVLNDEDNL